MTRPAWQRITCSLLLTLSGACTATSAWAQTAYGKVLEATPIYEEVAIPQEDCTEFSKLKRCEMSTSYEEKLVGYDVLYEYQGQQYAQRMAQKPGARIPIQTRATASSYGSADRNNSATATPGKKSFGSIAPGAPRVESIQYQNDSPEPLLNIDLRMGHPQRPHR